MYTISHYAATMHENPTRGNGLPYNEAVAYNQRKKEKNRRCYREPEQLQPRDWHGRFCQLNKTP